MIELCNKLRLEPGVRYTKTTFPYGACTVMEIPSIPNSIVEVLCTNDDVYEYKCIDGFY